MMNLSPLKCWLHNRQFTLYCFFGNAATPTMLLAWWVNAEWILVEWCLILKLTLRQGFRVSILFGNWKNHLQRSGELKKGGNTVNRGYDTESQLAPLGTISFCFTEARQGWRLSSSLHSCPRGRELCMARSGALSCPALLPWSFSVVPGGFVEIQLPTRSHWHQGWRKVGY